MTRPLRIVHCFRSPVGGIFRHVRDLTDAQMAEGHEIGIVCDSSTGGDFEDALFREMEPKLALGIRRTPMQRHVGFGDVASAWRTFRLVRALDPDILHGHGAKGGVYARLFGTMLRLSGKPVARVYSAHGGSLHYDADTLTGRSFFALEWLMGRFTDYLLFVSDYERKAYQTKVGTPPVPNRLVHNGLRAAEFEKVTPAPDAADFLYIGMMRDLKGPDLFLDALAEAETLCGRRLTAEMVGDGDDKPRYVEQAARLGLADRVAFHAAMPARQAFARARIVVIPSRAEAMPYIVLEALAAGRPMIASAVGGIPEIFGAGSPALVEPRSAAIAATMAAALANEDAWAARMPDAGTLKARFGVETMSREIEEAYRTALGENAPDA